MSEWAAWQKEFRYGALVIRPPAQVRRTVDRLRAECDPASHAWYGAHITLTQPFLRAPQEEDWARLAQVTAGFDPFRVKYGPLDSFLPYPCIWFAVRPKERILEIRAALHRTGLFNLSLPHTEGFIPHMTITEGRSGPKVDGGLLAQLGTRTAEGSFLCTEVAFYAPDDEFRFTVRRTLALRGKGEAEPSQAKGARDDGPVR